MTAFSRRTLQTAALGLALMAAGAAPAWSQAAPGSAPIVGISTVTSASGSAKITALNQSTRMVTLVFSDGRSGSYKAGDAVQNLAQMNVGDTIEVAYEERQSFVLSGPNARTPRDREVTGSVRTGPGQVPAGAVASQTVLNWIVVSANVAGSTISLVDPAGGQVRTFDVRTAEGRAELPRVKPGDKLTSISTELIIIAVVPKR